MMNGVASQPLYPPAGLVAYDPGWQSLYLELAAHLQQVLGHQWQVEHVGSTSVPGLLAKPVIDLALRVPGGETIHDHLPALAAAGWTDLTPLPSHEALFQLDHDGARRAIAHLIPADQWSTAPLRPFPAWLRSHPLDRDAYASLKQALRDGGLRGHEYTRAKAAFVQDISTRAGAPAEFGAGRVERDG